MIINRFSLPNNRLDRAHCSRYVTFDWFSRPPDIKVWKPLRRAKNKTVPTDGFVGAGACSQIQWYRVIVTKSRTEHVVTISKKYITVNLFELQWIKHKYDESKLRLRVIFFFFAGSFNGFLLFIYIYLHLFDKKRVIFNRAKVYAYQQLRRRTYMFILTSYVVRKWLFFYLRSTNTF